MARADVTPPVRAPGVAVEVLWWGYIYTGTREALIAAGQARPGTFPGDTGQRRTVGYGELHGRRVRLVKSGKHRVVLHFLFTEEERRIVARREELAKVLAQEQARLEALPKSAEDFRARLEQAQAFSATAFLQFARAGFGGFALDTPTLAAIEEAFGDAREALLRGGVVFSRERLDRECRAIHAEAARANPWVSEVLAARGIQPTSQPRPSV